MDNIAINFNKFISSISMALDLAESCAFRDSTISVNFEVPISDFEAYNHNFAIHSKRTAYIAKSIGDKMLLPKEAIKDLYIASFIHDIGAVDAFSISHTNKHFIRNHSDLGAMIVKSMPVNSEISDVLRFHHENYDGTGPNLVRGTEIPVNSLIIRAADIFELMYKENIPYRHQRDNIINYIKTGKSRLFAPDVVDALLECCKSERFWLDVSNINLDSEVLERIQPEMTTTIDLEQLESIAEVFAALIDKKSRFTHEHSIGVARLAEKFAKYYGFDETKTKMFRIAGYLHDLGKLSIPNSILDKPGALTNDEYATIKSHTYYTKLILGKIDGMEKIKEWAANHHENLKGTGYPECLKAESLSLESRIISVCDMYQALTEKRPYRTEMSKDKALSIIKSSVNTGTIDPIVSKNLEEIIAG